ncbi:hypothetical protein A6A06_11560 [Streptomyces sp. CB02923]|uniref:hypothetical protein n=1 Tax=Streptomyces sp. CB02923 TaxID=1718985 RepID=UPI00093DE575|nr:hypothetical protein [Streptomyces sp. CB02923]OKI05257.1 hypothetical protein A6A06_11560 [Streptomyces sp. CB02923]
MPAITVDVTEEELTELRAGAEKAGVSVERLAYAIVCESVARRRRQRSAAECAARSGAVGPFEAVLPPSDGKGT